MGEVSDEPAAARNPHGVRGWFAAGRRSPLKGLLLAALLLSAGGAHAQAVAFFAGQSNEGAWGTLPIWFSGTPGVNIVASASCYETTKPLTGASAASGTLTCVGPVTGNIYAGEQITSGGVAGQWVTAANNQGNFPGATGAGGAGTYAVNNPAAIGSATAPVAMTFAEPAIGGNPHCQIWNQPKPSKNPVAASWQTYNPRVNSEYGPIAVFGPEGEFCREWTADNPGQTLYMIKVAVPTAALCDMPGGTSYSPEYAGTVNTDAYTLLQSEVTAARAALPAAYPVIAIQWGQGEFDSTRTCGYPYLANMIDLIGRFAIPAPVSAAFTGSISGTTLTVSSITSGSLQPYQLVSGPGVAPQTYIVGKTGVGTYALQVYKTGAVTSPCVGAVHGQFVSCPKGVWLPYNVSQSVGAEAMTASVVGWGTSPATKFVAYRPFHSETTGVGTADESLNDNQGAALPVTVVNADDAIKIVGSPAHFHGSWVVELGRRLYAAYKGECDYHSPTC
jgi:hypothetical protein